MAKKNN